MPSPEEPETRRGRRPAHDRLLGTLLDGQFHIEAPIATGGFGAVYRATTADGQPVAVKVLHPGLSRDPSMVARFRREAATLTQLHDRHTVTTLAVGEAPDGTLYIAMELLTGESLHDRLQRQRALPWRAAVAIAGAVCSSLAEAHALGVVHRDLKPANIHLEPGDAVKVIDFGIAKIARGSAIDDGHELTFAGHMIGTCDYMSPEQIQGAALGEVSDVYALGVVLYEMLAGRRPFAAANGPAELMTALLTQSPPPLGVALPAELERVVRCCLEREPGDRWPGVRALAAALDRVVEADAADGATEVRRPFDPSAMVDDDRTWIDRAGLAERGVEGDTIRDDLREPGPRWRNARTAVDAEPPHGPLASGTGRVTPNATPSARPDARDPLYATLPGLAVAAAPTPTRPVPAHPTPSRQSPTPAALALTYPVAAPGWPGAPAGWTAPVRASDPALVHLPQASDPALIRRPIAPVRGRVVLWYALVLACVVAIVIAALAS